MKAFSLLILVALLIAPLQAATFTVGNSNDTGTGSLRDAITNSNGAGGANTLVWGTGGTITLGSDLPGINATTTLDVTASTNAVTIAAAPFAMPLNGALTFRNDSSNGATISAVIKDGAGAGSLNKTGSGVLTLSGANTYTGGTTITAGSLSITNNAALGTGGLTLSGGSLLFGANVGTVSNGVVLGANGTVNDQGFTGTLSGVISDGGGGFSLTKTGGGTLSLTGVNTYSGGTNLNGGILNVNADAALGNAAGGLTFNGGTLQTAAGIASARVVTLNGSGTIDTNGVNSTLSGAIGGTGELIKTGLGTLFLTGANNTYQGGTVVSNGVLNVNSDAALGGAANAFTFSSGTLQLAAAYASTRTFVFGSFAQFDNNGQNLALNGVLTGGGPVTYTGAGNVTLTGLNTYSGGTSIQGGNFITDTLNPFGGGAVSINAATSIQFAASSGVLLGNAFTLNQNVTFDTNGGSTTISGVISGTGALTKAGTGALVLAAGNTFTGGTTINNGILAITDDSSFGATTSGVSLLNGATIQLVDTLQSTLASARSIVLGAGGGVIDTRTDNLVLSGVLSGAGSLTKQGSGALYLGAVNTYGGPTYVEAGTLGITVDNALPGPTAVTVANGATLDLGNQKQTTAIAAFNGAGTLALTLQANQVNDPTTANNNLNVTGNFSVNTVVVRLAPQIVKTGDKFYPVNWGTNSGGNPKIVSPALISFTPTYAGAANKLELDAVLVPFANVPGLSQNSSALGASLEPMRANPSGDAATVLGNLYTLDTASLQTALQQMSPAGVGSALGGTALAGSAAQGTAISRRLATLADAGRADRPANYTVSGPAFPGTLYAAATGDTPMAASGGELGRWGYFASGVASGGRLTETNTTGGTNPGYAFNTQGLTGGADYRMNDNAALGVSAGWLRGHSSIYAPASGTVDSQSGRLGGYGTLFGEQLEADLYVGTAFDHFSTHRNVQFGQISRTASGTPNGWELNVHPALRYDYPTFNYGTYSPFYALNYDRLHVAGFSESGAAALDLAVGPQTIESLQQTLGLRWSQKIDADTFSWVPFASLGWRHEFQKQSRPITASFAEAGGAPFQIQSGDVARDGTVVGAGAALNWTKYTTFKLDWNSDFRSHYQNSSVELSLRSRF